MPVYARYTHLTYALDYHFVVYLFAVCLCASCLLPIVTLVSQPSFLSSYLLLELYALLLNLTLAYVQDILTSDVETFEEYIHFRPILAYKTRGSKTSKEFFSFKGFGRSSASSTSGVKILQSPLRSRLKKQRMSLIPSACTLAHTAYCIPYHHMWVCPAWYKRR